MTASKLDLDPGVIASCRETAAQIAGQVGDEIAGKTTVSVERTVARLLGEAVKRIHHGDSISSLFI